MKALSVLAALAISALSAVGAQAAGPAPEVARVIIVGGPGPAVVQSFPAEGATVPGGVLVVKIVFNQPMAPDGWSYARSDQGAFPDCLGQPRMLADQRTFVLLCTVAGRQSYALQINAAGSFASDNGRTARPTLLRFKTGDPGVFDMEAALSQASLKPEDDPIMRWRDKDAGAPAVASKAVEDEASGAKLASAH